MLSTNAVYHPPSGARLLPIAFAMVLGGGGAVLAVVHHGFVDCCAGAGG